MNRKYTSKRLPFAYDNSSLFLPWMVMLMVFFASLSLAGSLAAHNMTTKWNATMDGELSVQVVPPTEITGIESGDDIKNLMSLEINKVVDFLKKNPAVAEITVLPVDKLSGLLKPWLGDVVLADDFPLPRLIDVKLVQGAEPDLEQLKTDLFKVAPHASLDVYRVWLSKLMKLADVVNITALLILALVLVTTAFVVIYATVTSLDVHKNAIELLHLIGAKDGYIASLFAYRTMSFGFGGALIGILFALPIMIFVGMIAHFAEMGMLADARITSLNWFYIALVPFIAAGVCGATAYITVMFKLRRVL